jgi:hypothetical protein
MASSGGRSGQNAVSEFPDDPKFRDKIFPVTSIALPRLAFRVNFFSLWVTIPMVQRADLLLVRPVVCIHGYSRWHRVKVKKIWVAFSPKRARIAFASLAPKVIEPSICLDLLGVDAVTMISLFP